MNCMTLVNEEKNSRQWRLNIHKENAMFQVYKYTIQLFCQNAVRNCQWRTNIGCVRLLIIQLFPHTVVEMRERTMRIAMADPIYEEEEEEIEKKRALSVWMPITVLTGKCQNLFIHFLSNLCAIFRAIFYTNEYYVSLNECYVVGIFRWYW